MVNLISLRGKTNGVKNVINGVNVLLPSMSELAKAETEAPLDSPAGGQNSNQGLFDKGLQCTTYEQ